MEAQKTMKKYMKKLICIILVLVLVPAPIRTYADGCEGLTAVKPTLEDYVSRMNTDILYGNCCECGWELTEKQMNVCLNRFYNVQQKYSGALMCEIDGQKYYYPKFTLEWENRKLTVTESTRFKITRLPKGLNGIHTGIKVTAYENEKFEKIRQVNTLIKKYRCSYCTREQVDEILAKYKKFQDQYSGKFLCIDAHSNKELYCPNFTHEFNTASFDRRGYKQDALNVRWYVDVLGENKDGIIRGLEIGPFHIYMGTPDSSTRELIGLSKQFENDRASALPWATAKTIELFIPDIPVRIN